MRSTTSQVKSKNRPNPVTGEMENVFYGSDQEKDTRVQLHMDAALEYFYNKNQIRFDHFVGANFRYYHKSSRFDPTNHSARAFLGSGAYVNFKTDNASHMMKIKAGIMTMTKLNMPGTKVRLSDVRFQARADAYDQIIENWQENQLTNLLDHKLYLKHIVRTKCRVFPVNCLLKLYTFNNSINRIIAIKVCTII